MSEKEQKKLETCKDCKGNGYQRHLFEEGNIELITDCKPCNNQGEVDAEKR